MSDKKTIAVFFGGRSPEHDVSIVTGLQVLKALDPSRFDAFAVYITTDGQWYVGEELHERDNFLPTREMKKRLSNVTLDTRSTGNKKGVLISKQKSLFGGGKIVKEFDVAIPAFHGLFGEDGNIQGLFEVAGVPYTGMRTRASSVTMSKALAKDVMNLLKIPTLPYALIKRPQDGGYHIAVDKIEELLDGLVYPVCVKPCHLGSSIGVAKGNSAEEVQACLPAIFKYDSAAIVEPFVSNLVEYNVAVSALGGVVKTSAIERPKNTEELLDFKQKYLSGEGGKSGRKIPGQSSEGMLSLTRELNPQLDPKAEENIRSWAIALFEKLDGSGAPRIDFVSDSVTEEIWMNEVNPCPGSFGYFLWEAADDPVLFMDMLSSLIDEAIELNRQSALSADPVPVDAYLFKRTT